jgi:acid phosphatase family membrane protein YuiD
MSLLPLSLLTALVVQLSCQLFKLVVYSIRDGEFSPKYFTTAGGIPSAHTAFVVALAVSVGLRAGFASEVFAVAAVFAAIVMYDAYRLRGHVQRHAQILNRHVLRPTGAEPVSEMVGHSLLEIATGALFGGAVSLGIGLALGA